MDVLKIKILGMIVLIIGLAYCDEFSFEFYENLSDAMSSYMDFNYLEGVARADEAIHIKPDSTMGYCYKSLNLMGLGKYEESILSIDKAIELDNTGNRLAHFYYIKYLIYRSINDQVNKDLSLNTLREIAKNGTIGDILYLTDIFLIEERYEEAKLLLESCDLSGATKGDEIDLTEFLLIANYGCGDKSYIAKYKKYKRKNPKYRITIGFEPYLSLYYHMLGNNKKARYYLNKTDFNDLEKSNIENSKNGFRLAYSHLMNNNVYSELLDLKDKIQTNK